MLFVVGASRPNTLGRTLRALHPAVGIFDSDCFKGELKGGWGFLCFFVVGAPRPNTPGRTLRALHPAVGILDSDSFKGGFRV